MLPCNVVVQEVGDGTVEVAAVDPLASMASIDNPKLQAVADGVREKLQKVIAGLQRYPSVRHFGASNLGSTLDIPDQEIVLMRLAPRSSRA